MEPLQSLAPDRAVAPQHVTMQAPHEAAATAPLFEAIAVSAPAGSSLGARTVGPLTIVVSGCPNGGSAFLSCPLPFPLPAKAAGAASAAARVTSTSAYRMTSFPVVLAPTTAPSR